MPWASAGIWATTALREVGVSRTFRVSGATTPRTEYCGRRTRGGAAATGGRAGGGRAAPGVVKAAGGGSAPGGGGRVAGAATGRGGGATSGRGGGAAAGRGRESGSIGSMSTPRDRGVAGSSG